MMIYRIVPQKRYFIDVVKRDFLLILCSDSERLNIWNVENIEGMANRMAFVFQFDDVPNILIRTCMICHLPFNVSHLPFVFVHAFGCYRFVCFYCYAHLPKRNSNWMCLVNWLLVLLFVINFKSLHELLSLFLVSVILLFIFTKNDFMLIRHYRWLVWNPSQYNGKLLNWMQNSDWSDALRTKIRCSSHLDGNHFILCVGYWLPSYNITMLTTIST